MILRSGNITDETWIDLDDTVYRAIAEPKRTKLLLRAGDILLERSGGTDTRPVGRVAFIEHDIDAGFSNFLHRLRVNRSVADPSYVRFVLTQWHRSGRAVALQTQTTGIRNLMFSRYLAEPIRVPSLDVQRRIAAILEAATASLKTIDALIAAKREQKRGLMQQLLTGKVRFPGFTDPWKTVPMASMIMLDSPGAWGDAPTGSNPGVIVLRSTNISDDGQIVLRSTISRVLDPRKRAALSMQCGDILLERSGGTDTRPVGRVAFARTAIDACFSNFLQRLRPDKTAVDPRFLFLQLLQLHASGATNRLQAQTTGIRNLMYRAYLKYLLPLPALDEQACICDAFDAVTDEIELLVEQREAFAMQRRGLMERLLSGDISIPSSDTSAA